MPPPSRLLACSPHAVSRIALLNIQQNGALKSRARYATVADDASISTPLPEQPGSGKVRQRKRVSEMPVALLMPDGTTAKPLEEWSGGLGSSRRTKRTEQDVPATADTTLLQATEGISTPAKRKGRSKKVVEDGAIEQDIATAPSTRGRRKKADVVPEPEPAVVTTVPKRRHAKSSAQEGFEKPPVRQPRNQLAVEILDNLAKYPHCILLTRVGQFYESYFDQAEEVAKLLNIKLTSRPWDGQRVAQCGFPIAHLERYLKMLVQQHKRFVALCEEFPRPQYEGPGLERRVVRVLTPGTLLDEPFLNTYENNYLLALSSVPATAPATETTIGLAWIDVSTGEFFAKTTTETGLHDEIVRLGPREIVLDKGLEDEPSHPIRRALQEEGCFVSYIEQPDIPVAHEGSSNLSAPISASDDITGVDTPTLTGESNAETQSVRLLTSYLHTTMLEHMPRLSAPRREQDSGRMHIDAHTLTALEIRESMREGGGVAGSLLAVVKRTVTNGGTRLLARWLSSPSASIPEIAARQSLVAFFKARAHLRADLCTMLAESSDATRVVQRFLAGRGDASDLAALYRTIDAWAVLVRRIHLERSMEAQEHGGAADAEEWKSLDALAARMADLNSVAVKIAGALRNTGNTPSAVGPDEDAENEDAPVEDLMDDASDESNTDVQLSSEKWTIKPEFSQELTELHATLQRLHTERIDLETSLQNKYDTPSLSLRSSRSLGMHVHIARSKRDKAKLTKSDEASQFVSISESGTTCSFFYQKWSILGSQIIEATAAITAAEKAAFENLRSEVNAASELIRRNARILDELDVTLSFANLAEEMGFVRPVLKEDITYNVVNGRHPSVELGLLSSGRVFTPNTVSMGPDSQLLLITGPNMAGKSTLLRQTALIAILAQVGSFVPADSAEIGIIDGLFSRVGAKDDLFRDRSTFMVEMLETAEILRRATPKSLVIMDEVGRGTTVKDGLAIAFSTVHHLHSINGCRALFATHFHELADMLGYSDNHRGLGKYENVRFFCTDVAETEDGLVSYSHRLKPGLNRDSHGIKVAQLAGMPNAAVEMASGVLAALRAQGIGMDRQALQDLGQVSDQFVTSNSTSSQSNSDSSATRSWLQQFSWFGTSKHSNQQ